MSRSAQVNHTLGGLEWIPRFIHALDQKLCSQCCLCIKLCPGGVFRRTVKGTVEPVNAKNCIGCTVCEKNCPCHAITCLPYEQHFVGRHDKTPET